MRARMRSQGSENPVTLLPPQPQLMQRNLSNIQPDTVNPDNDSNSNSNRVVALYTPFLQNGTTNSQNIAATNTAIPETSCASPMARNSAAAPCSSNTPTQAAENLPQEDPLPAGWEMRYDVYGRR